MSEKQLSETSEQGASEATSLTNATDTPPHRYTAALAQEIELGWQERWEAEHTFETPNPAGLLGDPELMAARGEKLFVLDMFPYPSGAGLHVGHPLGFIGTDVYSRFKRMTGHNVLYSMGFDAFGLPAEQYAVQTGQHPKITTDQNVATMRRQLRRLGLSHDPRRSVATTDPGYYRWTQWIFNQIFGAWYDTELDRARPIAELIAELESGTRPTPDGRPWAELTVAERRDMIDGQRLAVVGDAPVNWCPGLGTVVANEEVTADGRSDRGNFPVFKRNMRQWVMRITSYADRLIDDLDTLDWTDAIKTMQRNWIGRSSGALVHFGSPAGPISVFTTRPDTLFGATFMVLSPEHPLVDALTAREESLAVASYRRAAIIKKDIERQDEGREKTGVPTGMTAVNPVTGEDIPIWVADYVLMGYGTGAIMAVPCGDQRDFEFAAKYGLEIPAIQQPPDTWFAEQGIAPTLDTSRWPVAFTGDAPYVNSSNHNSGNDSLNLNGIDSVAEGVRLTNEWLAANGHGEATITYKLRDWLFSRQRYWGEPFPIVYDDDGRPHALPDEMLPVELPDTTSFSPRTFDPDDEFSDPESPLDRLESWVTVELDLGDGPKRYRRDTNVMPQWAGSCWYELRYTDPTNEQAFVDPAVEAYWMGPRTDVRPDHPGGVDLYVGGVEHAVLHLLYARFWHKVLYDLGHLSSKEPYARLFNQGYILADAYKDEREIYIDAFDVEERDGAYFHDGRPVTREWGKMGKSLKNAVSPDDMYDQYGADTLRLYEMAMGPLDVSRPWDTRAVVGQYRLLQRLWRNVVDEATGEVTVTDSEPEEATLRALHKAIDGVTGDLAGLRFNTAIAKITELNNHLTKAGGPVPRAIAEPLVLLIAPLAPHIAEELWRRLGHSGSLADADLPVADPALVQDEAVTCVVQIKGKVKARLEVPPAIADAELEALAMGDPAVVAALGDATVRKVIVRAPKLVNVVPN
jgi:leucyl-tRNA synthetase